ncbi:unnamed protein product [Fusarium graminearum]|uniref:Chromosome 1, complete genome n=1 Tax=Gibberella zeae (strain ATCC MYA-4620 / CBS 123657 / FGSC 9075 / NRRL 31084 / PH-1) TaxID=229533 RepID=A0A0E0RUU5_GIBZE|nr:hypothetical protein FG05_30120 [Fusarium graminearum]CEF75020.1 unnamed protein product [Fusarium graminearum]CZS78298.1 unnamed protein product [Fusarium graminearum]
MRQSLVLCQTVNDKIYANDVYKVEVQTPIDDESCGNPYAVDRDVDSSDEHSDDNFETVGFLCMCEEYAASVDDDLEEKLDLPRMLSPKLDNDYTYE